MADEKKESVREEVKMCVAFGSDEKDSGLSSGRI
jgi:hypothetical protein